MRLTIIIIITGLWRSVELVDRQEMFSDRENSALPRLQSEPTEKVKTKRGNSIFDESKEKIVMKENKI